MLQLPDIDNCVFVHYARNYFHVGKEVFVLGARLDEQSKIWRVDEEEEASIISKLYSFLGDHPEKVIVNWNMDGNSYGPKHISDRYIQINNSTLPMLPNAWFNLSKYMWEKYGEYIQQPHLTNLCHFNDIQIFGINTHPEEYKTLQGKAWSVETHLIAIERILYKEVKRTLKIPNITPSSTSLVTESKVKRGPYKKPERDAVEKYFKESIQSAIEQALRNNRVPDKGKIIAAAYKNLSDKVNSNGSPKYNDRTLRDYLPSDYKSKLFGEIYRQVSERMGQYIK